MKKIFKLFNYFFIGFSYLASKKIIVILIFSIFIILLSLLDKSYAYKIELDNINNVNLENKSLEEVKVYDNSAFVLPKNSALNEKISCYNEKVDYNKLPAIVVDKINLLNELFKSDVEHFSFLYRDIETGFTVSYNETGEIFVASTIKAPAVIYLYELASRGEINLDEKLTYTSNFYNKGSGVIKEDQVGSEYTVEKLLEYVIHYSDNIAYAMLMNRYGRDNIYNFWHDLGTNSIFKYNNIWGVTSANDAGIYMSELYRFYLENEEYGSKLMNLFKNAGWKMVSNKEGIFNTANKGGWSDKSFHDCAIVFEENPYILIIMSNKGEGDYNTLFKKTNKLVGELHEEYWRYKESVCGNIKQY